ncbi:MAG: iron complex outerrane recepter protein [Blastocatellia bacterium]|nr:iron complex outerrane recepter protein [Blastocatellia bacterium]
MGRAQLPVGAGSDANRRKVGDSKHGRQIFLLIAFLFAIRSIAFAQGPSSPPSGTTPVDANGNAMSEAERVIVTGSNIPTAEEVGSNPVDTYRRDDITRLGARTPTDLIQRIPAVTGFGNTENNTNSILIPADGSTRVNLRGIDPKETLILQDGRRLANVGFAGTSVDFNEFPLGLIDHIDILKDGASPVYGTDAVAGVINVFLIHRFRGLELYTSYGNSNLGFAGDMGQEVDYLLAGTGDDKTNIVVYAGLFNEAAIYSRDTNIGHDSDYTRWGGIDARSGNFAGRVRGFQFAPKFNPAASGLLSPTPHFAANANTDPQYLSRSSGLIPREQLAFNFGDFTPAIAPTDREYLYGSFDRDICEKYLTVFADFKYFRQFWDGGLAPAPFAPDIWSDANHPFGISSGGISVPIQNAFNPFTVADYTSPGGFNPAFPNTRASEAPPGTELTTGVRYRSLETGLRTDKITTENYLFTGGLKGNLGEFTSAWDKLKTWEWETGVRWNEDFRTERFGGIVNNNALRTALLDTNPATAFNAFGLNQNNKAVIDRVFVTTNHIGSTTLLTEDFKLDGDLWDLPGGVVSFAIGVEHLSNTTSDNPDALTASGQTTGATNFAPTRGSRDAWSEYWELRIPVTGPMWNFPGANSLEFDYAERFENYSDFGTTERPKFSVRWQPLGGSPVPLTLRAAYIEAFHAPSLSDLFAGAVQGGFGQIHDPLTGTEPEVEQDFSGNRSLKPEIAYERTFGGVLTPEAWWSWPHGLTISVDYGRLDVRGFQSTLDPQFIVHHESEFPGLVVRDPSQGNIIILVRDPEQNVGRFIESYVDYEAVEVFETARLGHGDWGTFTATFNGTYLIDVDVQTFPGAKRFTAVGKFGGGFQGTQSGGNYSHNRWYASLFYDGASGTWMQGMDAGAVVHYIGQYWDNRDFTFNGSDRKVREWTTLDLIFNYTFNLPPPAAQTDVAGYTKDAGTAGPMKTGEKKIMPISSAEYNPCGWRSWLNHTTITLGVNNVFDLEPPFVAAAFENGFDEVTANAKGRFWYVAVKKRF